MEQVYEVALWLSPPGGDVFVDYVEQVQAAFPLAAVVCVMEQYGLERVVYAAVALGKGRGIVRFEQGVCVTRGC